jgi:hypothetical protein
MADETKVIRVGRGSGSLGGSLWAMGWLFTIGYLHLPVVKAIFAIVLWPYYIGVTLPH